MTAEHWPLWAIQIDHPAYTMHLTVRQANVARAMGVVIDHLENDDDNLEREAVQVTVRLINEH